MPQKTKATPMMEQYLEIKSQYPDAFLFYRLGDFYEMFYDDALEAAKLLEITLTSRNKNAEDPIPMCGIPHHSAADYIRTLVEGGHKVAICEQMEDPKLTKGMVRREVVQVLTPGTYMEGTGSKANNYLAALYPGRSHYPLAYADVGTGELKVAILENEDAVLNELQALHSKEIVLPGGASPLLVEKLRERLGIVVSFQKSRGEEEAFTEILTDIDEPPCRDVILLLLGYLADTQLRSLSHMQPAERYEPDQFLRMDAYARRNLELVASLRTQKKAGSLLGFLDKTKTAMGGRKLKQWLEKPLINQTDIEERQEKVASFLEHYFERVDIREALTSVYDLERLVAKVAFGNVNGRELIQLKTSLEQLPLIHYALSSLDNPVWGQTLEELEEMPELVALIGSALVDDPPLLIKEGNLIRDGFHDTLDRYRDAMNNGKKWIAALQQKEREATGIKSLKIGFNRVFGYYIEVSKANIPSLPEGRYERKQTLVNAERFITPELKEKERLIMEAEEKSALLEHELFVALREKVKEYSDQLQLIAKHIAEIDVLQCFAEVSEIYRYVRPQLHSETRTIQISDGRHPVVEEVLGKDKFVANSLLMDEEERILLITGPNMSGKSTYMRQVALIVIMAQMGCFVPAAEAQLPIFDQIFTRIGAADDLYSGQSTFMVEMVETNQALQYATERSLILFDEIGRGTATYDGMALAEAILRHLERGGKGKILFSTHYHELTVLEQELPSLMNVHVGAVEKDGKLVFLHKVMKGPADKSYGLHVAKLAGMPDRLIQEAQHILHRLEEQARETAAGEQAQAEQLALFQEPALTPNEQQVLDEVSAFDLNRVSPLQALNTIASWQELLAEGERG